MKESLGLACDNLKSIGFVTLSYSPELRVAVEKSIESWKHFCALPSEAKKGLPYSNNADGVGYELKDGVGIHADKKENFDVTIAGQEWLRNNIVNFQNNTALKFVQEATVLVGIMKPIIMKFAQQCEKLFDLEGFVDEVAASEDSFFVRFIHYFGDRDLNEEIAAPHVDQSGFTLHLFESAPGLQCLNQNGFWIDMPVSSGETVIIPAMQMQLRSEGNLLALCHRVVATEESINNEGRYSAVCFVQLKHTKKYDKEKQGRLQEKTEGFNYYMPYEVFATLFK